MKGSVNIVSECLNFIIVLHVKTYSFVTAYYLLQSKWSRSMMSTHLI